MFLSFPWTYNFSCQIKRSQGDMRLEIYPYLEYRRFLPSQFFLQQTTKTLVSLLSFKVDLMLKNIIGNGKILFQNMQVLLIIQMRCNLSTCTLLRNNVSTINFFSLLINYHSFLLNIQHPMNNR